MAVTTTRRERKSATAETNTTYRRKDIEGLRAIAVLFVLVWHAGITWLPGGFVGVDVFFVVSGFLMTSILHREMIKTKTVAVGNFYARRARRLIPASAATLVVTGIATYLFLPQNRWWDIGLDIASAGGYIVNWRLAERSVDYLAQDAAPSPIQHFWSLSVEEQFYIFWPLLIIALAWIVKIIHGNATRWVFSTLSIIAIGSLAWSIYLTDANPGRAYFVSTTRVWELALGGLIALAIPIAAKLPAALAAAMSWIGVAGILGTGFLLTTAVPFPGSVALIPTVATALVLASGPAAGRLGPVRIFDNPVVQWIGGCSYSMYLWHWPVLIIGGYILTDGLREITLTEGIALVALSVIPAWLSLKYIENPVREAESIKSSVKNSLYLAFFGIAICLVVGLILALAGPRPSTDTYVSQYTPAGTTMTEVKLMGAEVLRENPRDDPAGAPVDSVAGMVPSVSLIANDYDKCDVSKITDSSVVKCTISRGSNGTVALVGDSHAQQWIPALSAIAKERGWTLDAYLHDSCPFAVGEVRRDGKRYSECIDWNTSMREMISTSNDIDMVVTSSFTDRAVVNGMTVADAFKGAWEPMLQSGKQVVVLRDTPYLGIDQAECIAANSGELTKCARSRAEAIDGIGADQVTAATALPAVTLIDLNDAICPTEQCAAVIGDVVVYRDKSHITQSYMRTLENRLNAVLPPIS